MTDENLNYADPDPVVEGLKSDLVSLRRDIGNVVSLNQQAQQAEIAELTRKMTAAEREFVQHTPDYTEAAQSWKEKRLSEIRATLKASGQPEHLADRVLAGDIARIAARAEVSERNPAEVAYELFERAGHRSVHLDGPKTEVGSILKEIYK